MAVSRRYFYDVESLRRRFPEGEKRRDRTEFERDLARLKHSFSLRRLSGVTQVFQSDGRRTVRNRYSHSIEVADIAGAIATALGTDPELVSAAALAHDLGHPPFGHHGEFVLDKYARELGLDGYEGNAQTLSVISRLEPKLFANGSYYGINPTRAFADSTIKYPWHDGEKPGPKFGVYSHDIDYYEWVRQGVAPYKLCVEAQIMDWADDVAYSTHDIEDGILAGMIEIHELADPDERLAICEFATKHSANSAHSGNSGESITGTQISLPDALAAHDRIMALDSMRHLAGIQRRALDAPAIIKEFTGGLIDRFVDEAVAATVRRFGGQPIGRYDGALVVPVEVRAEAEVLKAITWRYVIESKRFQRQRGKEVELLHDVAKRLVAIHYQMLGGRGTSWDKAVWSGTDPLFALLWSQALDPAKPERQRLRGVFDAVGALTDQGLITLGAALPAVSK